MAQVELNRKAKAVALASDNPSNLSSLSSAWDFNAPMFADLTKIKPNAIYDDDAVDESYFSEFY